jgi:hypothetical protein
MDVKKIGGEIPPLAFGKKGKREELEGTDFQKALQEAHSHLQGSLAPSVSTGDVGGAERLEPIPFPLLPPNFEAGAAPLQSQGAQATERTLDLLEQYQEALSDPRVSLKEVYPLVQALSQEVQGMNRWTEQLPPSDPLRKIMGAIEILSNVEIEKFNRGDYV